MYATPLEQNAQSVLRQMAQQPFMVSESIREDLAELANILKQNGKNPKLLKEVMDDIAFYDEIVTKRIVQSSVC